MVEVDTVYLAAATTASVTSGGASHETYSSVGKLIYTVSVNGTFSRTSQSCSTTSNSGAFTPGNGSLWSSTPTISKGNITTMKAYARTSGTANWLLLHRTYQLTLMCDTTGNLTSSFTEP